MKTFIELAKTNKDPFMKFCFEDEKQFTYKKLEMRENGYITAIIENSGATIDFLTDKSFWDKKVLVRHIDSETRSIVWK